MGLSATHLMLLLVIVVLLFGRNKISDLMGDVAKGIKSFKKGLQDDADEAKKPDETAKSLEAQKAPTTESSTTGTKVG